MAASVYREVIIPDGRAKVVWGDAPSQCSREGAVDRVVLAFGIFWSV